MSDIIVGGLVGFVIFVSMFVGLYLYSDFTKLRLIRFKPEGEEYWDIAFSEDEMYKKLNGRMAEIVMPAKPILIRLWRLVKGRTL